MDRGQVAALGLASEQVGGWQAVWSMTVDYVKDRRQFSRPIGSFQAVKHALADVLVDLELARSALSRALDVAPGGTRSVSYTHPPSPETVLALVCPSRLE